MEEMLKTKADTAYAGELSGLSEAERLEQLLPESEVIKLKEEPLCQFCAQKHPNPSQCYALFDLVNPGTKDLENGAIVTVEIPCCKRCESNFKRLSTWPAALTLFICAAGLLVLSLLSVEFRLKAYGMYIPFVLFVLVIALAWGSGAVLKSVLKSRAGRETRLDVMELDAVKLWGQNGWQELFRGKEGISRPAFSDKYAK